MSGLFISKIKNLCLKAYLHWLHLFLSWSLCVIKCLFKTLVPEETKLQWLHLYEFSPVCIFKWVLKMCGCISQKAAPRLLQGRATSFKTLWSSISSILYLLITTSLQFGVAHGQALLYVSYHQVLQGKGSHLQNVVLLHLLHLHHHLTPVSCCTWSGSALCRPPPNPPHESELQTLPLSLSILSFFGL